MTAITNFNHETFVKHMNRVVDRKIKDPIKNDLMKKMYDSLYEESFEDGELIDTVELCIEDNRWCKVVKKGDEFFDEILEQTEDGTWMETDYGRVEAINDDKTALLIRYMNS